MNYRLMMTGAAFAVALAGHSYAQELSKIQQGELAQIGVEYAQQGAKLKTSIEQKLADLSTELHREGRLDTDEAAVVSSQRVNAILTEVGELYGTFIKTKVEFVLKAKNVLTAEQKIHLLSQLESQTTLASGALEQMNPSLFDLPINLTVEQQKKLIGLETALLVEEIKLASEVEITLLDLKVELLSGQATPAVVDPLVMNLATLAAKDINNRVEYFLTAKDVLTLDQKRLMVYLMGLN